MSPIERFLGAEAMRAGPFGLLRITPETCTDERILASLEWQLDRVGQHAEADTPEADEVRLALHAAAAQLLDPAVRRHAIAALRERGEQVEAGGGPEMVRGAGRGVRLTGLEQDALRTLAAYGGWNKQSLERLRALAHARGMGAQEVVQTLQNLSTPRRKPAPAAGVAPGSRADASPPLASARMPMAGAGSEREAEAKRPPTRFVDPGARYVRNLVLGVVGIMVVLAGMVVIAALVLRPPGGAPGAPAPGPVAGPVAGDGTGTTAGGVEQPITRATERPAGDGAAKGETETARAGSKTPPRSVGPEPVDPVALVRGLTEAAGRARKEPELAAESFPGLVRQLASRWCKLEQSQRRAADVAVLDVIFATSGYPEVSERVMDAVMEGARRLGAPGALSAEETWAAAWSVGILTRLSRERELPHTLSSSVDGALTAAVGRDRPRTDTTFETGALAALRRIPERLVAGEAPASGKGEKSGVLLKPWIEALDATIGTDAELRERVLVEALQKILLDAAEASADQRVFDSVQTLVTEIKWRKGGPARGRLLDWFKDTRVSMQDLQVVTSVLASRSSAEGVDPLMVLSAGATPSDRQRLRSEYAKAWGIAESIGDDKASSAWLAAARGEIERAWDGVRRTEFLVTAVSLARLNEAAARLWRGEPEAVESLVGDAASLPASNIMTVQGRQAVMQRVDGDGQWTSGYASVGRNTALRGEKLQQLESTAVGLGPIDAEYLVYLACFESPVELRVAAQRIVERFADEATVVNAALELLPRAPRYTSVASLYERLGRRRLPAPSDDGWELEARRALVSRLLELLAGGGEDAKVDELARMLFESYSVLAGGTGLAETAANDGSDLDAGLDAVALLGRVWRGAADAVAPNEFAPVALDVIDRRRVGRLRLAQGPVQRFAAEQVTASELMAYVVSAEKPRLAVDVKAVMDEMHAGRRGATHIFEQIAHTERAMLRLWVLRLKGES